MGLLILLVVGAALGWLAAVLLNIVATPRVMLLVGVGAGSAATAGLLASGGRAAYSLSPLALLVGVAGSLIGLAAFNYLRRVQIR